MLSSLSPCRCEQASLLSFAAGELGSACLSHLGCSGQGMPSVQSMFWCSCVCPVLKPMHLSRCSLGVWEMGRSVHLWVDGLVASLRNLTSSAGPEPCSWAGPSAPGHFSKSLSLLPFQSPFFLPNYVMQAGILQAGPFPVHSPNMLMECHLSCHRWEQGSQLISSM